MSMMVLVSYDVSTQDEGSARRLRRIARACRDFGQRVQYSVFEIELDHAQWVSLKADLSAIIDPLTDSLRFYYLGSGWKRKIEHIGTKPTLDMSGPLIF